MAKNSRANRNEKNLAVVGIDSGFYHAIYGPLNVPSKRFMRTVSIWVPSRSQNVALRSFTKSAGVVVSRSAAGDAGAGVSVVGSPEVAGRGKTRNEKTMLEVLRSCSCCLSSRGGVTRRPGAYWEGVTSGNPRALHQLAELFPVPLVVFLRGLAGDSTDHGGL